MKVGLLGGTFDPIHLGHLAAAEVALTCGDLDRVVLVPSSVPPHKPPPSAPATARLEMCRLAVAERPEFEVSDVEIRRGGPSYTLETLLEFRRQRPEDEHLLILGWDAARELRSWHRPDEVLAEARLVVLSRPTLPSPLAADLTQAGLDPSRTTICEESTPDIRATDIRRRAASGESLRGLVPTPVEDFIRTHRLYRSPAPSP